MRVGVAARGRVRVRFDKLSNKSNAYNFNAYEMISFRDARRSFKFGAWRAAWRVGRGCQCVQVCMCVRAKYKRRRCQSRWGNYFDEKWQFQ